jgi:hypothetical protein
MALLRARQVSILFGLYMTTERHAALPGFFDPDPDNTLFGHVDIILLSG